METEPVNITCPSCQTEGSVDGRYIGCSIKCNNCGTMFTVTPSKLDNPFTLPTSPTSFSSDHTAQSVIIPNSTRSTFPVLSTIIISCLFAFAIIIVFAIRTNNSNRHGSKANNSNPLIGKWDITQGEDTFGKVGETIEFFNNGSIGTAHSALYRYEVIDRNTIEIGVSNITLNRYTIINSGDSLELRSFKGSLLTLVRQQELIPSNDTVSGFWAPDPSLAQSSDPEISGMYGGYSRSKRSLHELTDEYINMGYYDDWIVITLKKDGSAELNSRIDCQFSSSYSEVKMNGNFGVHDKQLTLTMSGAYNTWKKNYETGQTNNSYQREISGKSIKFGIASLTPNKMVINDTQGYLYTFRRTTVDASGVPALKQ